MATIMAAAIDTTAANFSAEEALIDAYDLQWKAIDIRLEKLRNECERMILEYEVEVKQQMYMRECEELMRQQAEEHEAQHAMLTRELQEKDRQLADARVEAEAMAQQQQQQKKKMIEEKTEKAVVVATAPKKKAEKRKPVEEKHASTDEESVEEEEETTKPKLKAKKPSKKKEEDKKKEEEEPKKKTQKKAVKAITSEKPVERPVSPPIFSPEEEPKEEQQPQQRKDELPVSTSIVETPSVATDELLDMLTQEPEYESEDFGDASSLSLIHPQSPAVQSPPRPKQQAAQPTVASPLRVKQPTKPVAASPMRAGVMSLTDRIRNRMQAIAKELLDAQSDSSISPAPIEAPPPPKRALKRRKTALLPSTPVSAATTAQAPVADKEKDATAEAGGVKAKKTTKKTTETNAEKEAEPGTAAVAVAAKKKNAATKKTQKQPEAEAGPEEADEGASDEQEAAPTTKTVSKKQGRAALGGAITGRSKARQTAKLAALRAAVDEDPFPMTGFSGINDIKTPKVPRVKLGVDGKKKQISDLASKRAEFQQIMSESIRDDAEEESASAEEGPHAIAGKKRRRRELEEKKQTAAVDADEGYGLKTPKPKAKKLKTNKNMFANDELNIMKSPVPLLRAKIAEKKKQEEAAEVNSKKNKRTVSEREGVDEEDPEYGAPAAAVPASSAIATQPASTLAPTAKSSEESQQAALDYANRWLNSGLVTRAKKNAVKAAKKPSAKPAKPASMWGSGPSFFDAFVNTAAPAIPRLKTASLLPKE